MAENATTEPRVTGLNHLTLAVADLERALAFYRDLLSLHPRAIWPEGAYLEAGALWLCLSVDPAARTARREDYTHIAFDVPPEAFDALSDRVAAAAPIWRQNRSQGPSLYVLDPDGHRLEIHAGSLADRLAHYRAHPAPGRVVFD